jgi:hypothetical protein
MEKDRVEISINSLIIKAISIVKNEELYNINLIDEIELMHYTKILKSLSKEKVKARGVMKDATASFMQNLIRLMGYKNTNSLKYANLLSTTC